TAFTPDLVLHVSKIDGIIAESPKGARRFLRHFSFEKFSHISEIPTLLLNEHTHEKEKIELLAPLLKGETWGLVSDAGLPCIADPGSDLVFLARTKGIAIQSFPGPSSILMALQLSSLPAQSFAFHGYAKKKPEE